MNGYYEQRLIKPMFLKEVSLYLNLLNIVNKNLKDFFYIKSIIPQMFYVLLKSQLLYLIVQPLL